MQMFHVTLFVRFISHRIVSFPAIINYVKSKSVKLHRKDLPTSPNRPDKTLKSTRD
jgi:hypothetical protein